MRKIFLLIYGKELGGNKFAWEKLPPRYPVPIAIGIFQDLMI